MLYHMGKEPTCLCRVNHTEPSPPTELWVSATRGNLAGQKRENGKCHVQQVAHGLAGVV